MNLQEKIKQEKEELQKLIQQYNQGQQVVNTISQEILKKQGAIEALETVIDADKKGK